MSEIPYNIEEIKKFVKEEWHNASERDWQFCILISHIVVNSIHHQLHILQK